MRKNFKLITLPRVIQSESIASWLIRACQMHCLTFKLIYMALRLTPPQDADITSYDRLFKRFAYGTNLLPSHLNQISKWFEPLILSGRASKALHKEINGTPYTHFCHHCLKNDKIPHWRPEWRFKFWQVCPNHHCKMSEECPKCGEHQHTNKANLKLTLEQSDKALQFCVHCSADLTEKLPHSSFDEQANDKIIAQEYLLKICRYGEYSLNPQPHHYVGQRDFINPNNILSATQRLIVDFHMAYIDSQDVARKFYGFKNALSKRTYFALQK